MALYGLFPKEVSQHSTFFSHLLQASGLIFNLFGQENEHAYMFVKAWELKDGNI